MYATFTNSSQASAIFTTKELAEQVAEKQNAKAASMGIKSRYEVMEAEPTAADKARDTIPTIWL